jgi:hypothetical protein
MIINLNNYSGLDDAEFMAVCINEHVENGYSVKTASSICKIILANKKETEFSRAVKKGLESDII